MSEKAGSQCAKKGIYIAVQYTEYGSFTDKEGMAGCKLCRAIMLGKIVEEKGIGASAVPSYGDPFFSWTGWLSRIWSPSAAQFSGSTLALSTVGIYGYMGIYRHIWAESYYDSHSAELHSQVFIGNRKSI